MAPKEHEFLANTVLPLTPRNPHTCTHLLDFVILVHVEAEAHKACHNNLASLKAAANQARVFLSTVYSTKVSWSIRTSLQQCLVSSGGYIN